MRTTLFLILVLLVYCQFIRAKDLIIYKTIKPPVIDGIKTSDEVWSDSWNEIDQCKLDCRDFRARFQMCYDNTYLYIITEIFDATFDFNSETDSIYKDGVSLYFAWHETNKIVGTFTHEDWIFDNPRGFYEVYGKNLVFSNLRKWAKERDFKVSESNDSDGYIKEYQIPWADITYLKENEWLGKMFRFDISVSDFANGSISQKKFWNPRTDYNSMNTNYLGSVYLDSSVEIIDDRKPQTITFKPIGDKFFADGIFILEGQSSSLLPVTFRSHDTSVISVDSNKAIINGPGYTEIIAYQPGDSVYSPAMPVYQYLKVGDIDLVIYKTKTPPVLDGKMTEGEPWTTNVKNLEYSFNSALPPVQANFQMCYDDTCLYVLAKIYDDSPCNSCKFFDKNDCIELCLSSDIYRNKNAILLSKSWNTEIINGVSNNSSFILNNYFVAEEDNSGSYTQEWKIPWNLLSDSINVYGGLFKFDIRVKNNISSSCSDLFQSQVWNKDESFDWDNLKPCGLVKLSTDSVFPVDQICQVSVDAKSNKNVISWYKSHYQGIIKYNILKETSKGGVFNVIGTVSFNEPGLFIDEGSEPFRHADCYKLETINENNTSNGFSIMHKTIHLTVNAGNPGIYNLIWTEYSGFDFGTYYIFKGTSPDDLTLYDSVSNHVRSYTDKATGKVYYRVGVISNSPCPVSNLKSAELTERSKTGVSLSNIETVIGSGPGNISNFYISPNPFENEIFINGKNINSTLVNISIYNLLGKKLYENSYNNKDTDFQITINANEINEIPGFCIIKITAGEIIFNAKLIKK